MASQLYTYEAPTAQDLIEQCNKLSLVGLSGDWSFRGQADLCWRLTPSLLRTSLEHSDALRFEEDLITYFRKVFLLRTSLPTHLIEDEDFILAFAQHYRVPTRLSDWTRDPLMALYFAASGALREMSFKGRTSGKLVVFAMADIYLIGDARGKIIDPPHASNANLAAQRARVLKHAWENPDLLSNTAECPVRDPAGNVTALTDSRFVRLALDWRHAQEALAQLRRAGLTAELVYPSQDGLARFAEDLALDGWLESRKISPSMGFR